MLMSLLGMGNQNILQDAQLWLGYDQLGFNYANLQAQMNRDALLQSLGLI